MNESPVGSQERPCGDSHPARLQSLQYLAIALRSAHEGDMLHRADRVAVNLGDAFRIFEKSEQAVAAHIEKIMRDVLVGRRSDPVRGARVRRPRRRAQPMYERHPEHAHIEIERHRHIIGVEREAIHTAQYRLAFGNRALSGAGTSVPSLK